MGATDEQVIEAMVAACSHSALGLGPDVLRIALRSCKDETFRDTTVMLTPVWELLTEQGLNEDSVTNGLCRFKAWEGRLGVTVLLPTQLTALSVDEVSQRARKVVVPAATLDGILGLEVASPPRPDPTEEFCFHQPEPAPRRSLLKERIVGAVVILGALAFVFAGWQVYVLARGPAFEDVPATVLTGVVPVRDMKRLGTHVSGTLADAAWLQVPTEAREKQLLRARVQLAQVGVDSFVILGESKDVIATVQTTPRGEGHVVIQK